MKQIKDLPIRTISAIVLIAITIPLIIIGKIPFALGVGILSIFAFREIMGLQKFPIPVWLLSFLALISIIYSNFDANNIINGLNYKVIGLSLLLVLLPANFYQSKNKYNVNDAFKLYGFIFLIGIGLNFFILIRSLDIKFFILVLLTTVFTDTFAYISGTLIGKHKFSKISPNKSIEGCVMGSVVATFIMTMYYTSFISSNTSIFIIIGIILLMTIMGQIGDIFFSAIKRAYNIKDFSKLIPGHGGILDRLDSLIFVAITFMIFIEYL